jgi:DNA-binding transcriptional ArsR family regulator
VATTTSPLGFPALRDRLVRALREDDEDAARSLIRAFASQVGQALAARDADEVTRLRAQGARLRSRVHRADGNAGDRVEAQLELLDAMLEVQQTAEFMRRAQAGVLRDEILQALDDGPRRPRDLAARFGCDRSQVSRALRALEQASLVRRVPGPSAAGDRRALWYVSVGGPPRSAA